MVVLFHIDFKLLDLLFMEKLKILNKKYLIIILILKSVIFVFVNNKF